MCDNSRECCTPKAASFARPRVSRDDTFARAVGSAHEHADASASAAGAQGAGAGAWRVRPIRDDEHAAVLAIINDAAQRYRGVIPEDRWHDPYFSAAYLESEIAAGVRFFGFESDGELAGVMGVQDVDDVTLIRHAYVSTRAQRGGIGGRLLRSLLAKADGRPVLIGTWRAAEWAIAFYEKHGFRVTSREETEQLLRRYWDIPERQVETSVVLVER